MKHDQQISHTEVDRHLILLILLRAIQCVTVSSRTQKHFYLDSHIRLFCFSFYPRDAMLARVIVIATCLSVCLSRAGIVSKQRKLAA